MDKEELEELEEESGPDFDIVELRQNDAFNKFVQSEADKRAKTMEMKIKERYEEAYKEKEDLLIHAYEETVKEEDKKRQPIPKKTFDQQVRGRTKKQIVEYFEQDETYGKLGTTEIARCVDEISASDGTLEQLYKGMAESLADKRAVEFGKFATAKTKNEKDLDREAAETELRVERRSRAAEKGETAIGAVSGGWSTQIAGEEKSWEQIEQGYADGELTREEYEPARRQHDKERGKEVDPIKEDE